ncbi:MAG: ATP-binding protein, partial [Polyangiaceae bacterium]|nr:ATP-binding protein [Polyangiaceae bacterium]
MLADEPPFDVALGPPVRVDFQTRVDGWFLDDALVTTATAVGQHRFALSIKSNQQFTASCAPSDFVACAWEQWLHLGSTLLLPDSDFIGLVTGPLSAAAHASVSGLLGKARENDPELFPGRIATPNWASEHQRHLFRSFECPASVTAPVSPTEVDTARLLQRIRFAEMDFGDTGGESQKRALALLRRCVHGGEAPDAHAAWAALRSIAAELRPLAGSITRLQLVDRLRGRVRLADHPDHTADWKKLEARSAREASLVGDRIASRAHIQRPTGILALTRALETSDLIALVGPSGAGKSAAMRALFEARIAAGERTVWVAAQSLDCRDIDDFLAGLGLQHDLADLLAAEPSVRPVLLLDGADRLYADAAFRNIAALLHLVRPAPRATQWRVVVACQAQEWPRVSQALGRQAVVRGTWATVELAPPALADLKVVGESIPAVAALLLQPKLGVALTNLKLLDLVARRLEAEGGTDSPSWLGESSVAVWFWSAEVDRGPDGIARGRVARELATRQADSLMLSVAADDFGASDLVPLQSLASDKLCVQLSGDRIAFAHDLYGDWTRLRILLNHRASLPLFLRGRLDSPLWHRALRLLGAYMLERPGGLEEWRAAIASFDQSLMVQDVLVEASVFSPNAGDLLELVFEDLLVESGRRLRRLLARFLAFATLPDLQMLEIGLSVGMDAGAARSSFRQPYWPLWLPMLRLLHGHRTRVVAAAPDEVARLVEMWLAFPQKGSVGREHAADLAILLGRRALGARHDNNNDEDRGRFYKCTLAAASERPDDATAIALRGSERLAAAPEAPRPTRPRLRSRAERAPWPDGPRHPVDACLQKAVLDGPGALHLFRARPAVARQVVLANLIKAPEDDPMEHSIAAEELGLVYRFEWSPPLFLHGPFLGCLRHNFEQGLELVAQLVEFAAVRAREDARGGSSFWYDDDDQMLGVTLLGVSDTRFVPGNKRVYRWGAGQGTPPAAVASALMALEKYFYQRLDDGQEVSAEVAMAFGRAESTALLGVLCEVGKREPSLFEGPLRPLLSAPEIYSWEIAKRVEGRGHLLIGAPEKGAHFVQLAHEFHGLPHRATDLRTVAVALMTQHAAMRDYFDRCCDAWSANPERTGEFGEMRRQLSMALNFRNCRLAETSDGRVQLVNVATLRAQEARAAERVAIERSMLLMAFPSRCRNILDGREELGRERLAELWEQWLIVRRLAEGAESGDEPAEPLFESQYACAIAAGIAVFLGAGDWCAEYGRVPELTHALQRVLAGLVDESLGSRAEDVLSNTTPCFVADAVARLWLMAPRDREWRTAVGNVILS